MKIKSYFLTPPFVYYYKYHIFTGEGAGRIFCGDAGHFSYEEINYVKPGHNYGWNFREGGDCVRDDICAGGEYGFRQM